MFGLQRGTEVLKDIRKEMGGVEKVEKLMARNEEERQFAEEVAQMLSGQMTREEEDDVEDELAALEKEQGIKEGKKVDLPTAPTEDILDDRLPEAPEAAPIKQRQKQEPAQEERQMIPS